MNLSLMNKCYFHSKRKSTHMVAAPPKEAGPDCGAPIRKHLHLCKECFSQPKSDLLEAVEEYGEPLPEKPVKQSYS